MYLSMYCLKHAEYALEQLDTQTSLEDDKGFIETIKEGLYKLWLAVKKAFSAMWDFLYRVWGIVEIRLKRLYKWLFSKFPMSKQQINIAKYFQNKYPEDAYKLFDEQGHIIEIKPLSGEIGNIIEYRLMTIDEPGEMNERTNRYTTYDKHDDTIGLKKHDAKRVSFTPNDIAKWIDNTREYTKNARALAKKYKSQIDKLITDSQVELKFIKDDKDKAALLRKRLMRLKSLGKAIKLPYEVCSIQITRFHEFLNDYDEGAVD
nr:MAG TPA: hypothetical protein [Caudoviricetes sp.]